MTRARCIAAAALAACLAGAAWAQDTRPGTGAAGVGPHSCTRPNTVAACLNYDDPFNAGCGSRGGPGCRKDNGRCAAWRDGFAPDCRQHRPATGPSPAGAPPPAEPDEGS